MSRRVPILPTIVVIAAATVMVALGFWQLDRYEEKTALIARYQATFGNAAAVPFPASDQAAAGVLYRRSAVDCTTVLAMSAVNGTRADGAKGWAHKALCRTPPGQDVSVALGFSNVSQTPAWQGGPVAGIIAPGPRLVADPPQAGLEPLAKPDPGDLPNNHLAYAVQWFLFAATALVIYALALHRRGNKGGGT